MLDFFLLSAGGVLGRNLNQTVSARVGLVDTVLVEAVTSTFDFAVSGAPEGDTLVCRQQSKWRAVSVEPKRENQTGACDMHLGLAK